MNKVILIGNVGSDPEVRQAGQTKVVQLSLATNEYYTNKQGERVTNTEWHKLEAWDKKADIIEKYITKGSRIAIEGQIKTEKYTDNEGKERYITKIRVTSIEMLGGNQQDNSNGF